MAKVSIPTELLNKTTVRRPVITADAVKWPEYNYNDTLHRITRRNTKHDRGKFD
jgi:hypothetical protein